MTFYEMVLSILAPFLGALNWIVRKELQEILKRYPLKASCLDVGGRKSPYTIGMPAQITILDVPRENEVQRQAHLGLSEAMLMELKKTRSNISNIILEDMTHTTLPDSVFEGALAIEVIEHVENAQLFIEQIHRVLKPGGFLILTTPNADHPTRTHVTNLKDHHFFTRNELCVLLEAYFETVEVRYAVPVGKHFSNSLKSWSMARPLQTLRSMYGSVVNICETKSPNVKFQAVGTRELVAIAIKS